MHRAWGLLLAVALFAGCGGDDGGGSSGASYGTPAAKVASMFEAATGVPLTTLDDDEVWTTYVPPPSDAAAQQKYGPFTIYVVKHKGGEKTLLDGTQRDAAGIYWKSAGGGLWNGTKRYGDNVYLVVTGLPSKQPDAKFRRIDAALAG